MNVFNIHIEFDSKVLCNAIENYISTKQKAYVCVVDANVITIAQKDEKYRQIVNDANINTCDGSSISNMVNKIYGTDYHAFSGPELFDYYIEKPYKHLLVGNKASKVEQIKAKLREKGFNHGLLHLDLPFVSVDEFDYKGIADQINAIKPDIIWVSLGAPKQETFISNIFPYIESGVLFGIGAAFNFYIGELHHNKKEFAGMRIVWLERIFKEPKKQLKRVRNILLALPKMYLEEKRKARHLKAKL